MSIPNTLLKLLTDYSVEVPRVQRDYVQGRKDEHSTIVRTNLLNDIKRAFEKKSEPLDLNFVYGKISASKFYPVDGQQRLTTLFLLHLLAFSDDLSKTPLLLKFSYEARTTTRDFFKALVKNRKSVFCGPETPEEIISDAAWFIDSWRYDPSVSNAMTMLNDIANQVFDVANLKNQLEEENNPLVFFQFVKLDQLALEDDLYIKLNARGRALTSFENFKSKFIDRCSGICPDISDEIKSNLDNSWADLMWNIGKEKFDELYLRFFENVFLNYGVLKSESNKSVSKNWIYNLNYSDLFPDIFYSVRNTLNYLSYDSKSAAHKVIMEAISEVSPYPNRILFHAVCKYLSEENDPYLVNSDQFMDWMRVITNLVNNSRIEESDVYLRTVDSINALYPSRNSLLLYLATGVLKDLPGFLKEQFEEECLKARIICKDKAHRQAIVQSEKALPYFNGQIRSALYYSDFENKDDITTFEEYVNKISALFSDKKPKDGTLLRRALCSIGDYRLAVGNYKTFCIDDPNESSRTWSLKRLFSNHGNEVKTILDAIDISMPVDPQLKSLISGNTIPQNDWRYCLVSYPELFKLMSPSHLRMCSSYEQFLVPNKQSSGMNYSVYLYTLHLLLEKAGIKSEYVTENGANGARSLEVKNATVTFKNKIFTVEDLSGTTWKSSRVDIVDEVFAYIKGMP